MNGFQRTIVALAVIGVVGVASSGNALALSARSIIGPVISGVTAYIGGPFTAVLGQITGAATGKIAGEITKSTMANKAVLEGLEGYRQQIELKKDIVRIQEEAELPASTCSDMAAQDGLNKASRTVAAQTFSTQTKVLGKLSSNTNTVAMLRQVHEETNQKFCSAEEQARGICKVQTTGKYQGLDKADQRASYLFQSNGGELTHQNEAQTEAAKAYIDRVVVGLPPEQLRDPAAAKTEPGKAYTELLRRYEAYKSMSAYSLSYIEESTRPRVGLGNDTMMANVPGFTSKADMSMTEAVSRFVASKFSPEKVMDMKDASQPHKILRDMAQMAAFELWIDHQALLQGQRMEALQAHQLALLTEQTLRPQLEAQRAAATAGKR